jgi:hypothetical protein
VRPLGSEVLVMNPWKIGKGLHFNTFIHKFHSYTKILHWLLLHQVTDFYIITAPPNHMSSGFNGTSTSFEPGQSSSGGTSLEDKCNHNSHIT